MAEDSQGASREIAERVRANVLPGLIGAGLLLYFGFVRLSEPTGTGLFERANWWFFHALRIGGVCMAGVAAGSMTGHRTALLADAVVACPLGAVFVLTGPAMLIGGGDTLNGALITIFGAMFISEGLRSGRAFLTCAASRADASTELHSPATQSGRVLGTPLVGKPPVAPDREPLIGKSPVAPDRESLIGKPPVAPGVVTSTPSSEGNSFSSSQIGSPAPSGYLAAFAKKSTGESSTDVGAASHGS